MQEQDRLVAGAAASPNEENVDRALRPTVLRDYVGQEAIREQLHIFIAAARRRGEPLPETRPAYPDEARSYAVTAEQLRLRWEKQ